MCDDIFEDNDKDQEVFERDWRKSVNQINNAGYREGLDKGKEEVLQEGFNKAFSTSSQLVYRIAELRGKISAKLSNNLIRKGRLTDKQELDLQILLQDVVELESELLQCANINISDWISDSSKLYSDNGDTSIKSRIPVCDSDQSDEVRMEVKPVNRIETGAQEDKTEDQTKKSSESLIGRSVPEANSDKLNQIYIERKLVSLTKKFESIMNTQPLKPI